MRVVVAGGHGQIGRRLLRLLAERGHEAVGLVRNPAHVADLEALGRRGEVSRDDVAAVLAAALEEPATVGRELELLAGDTPIPEAVRAE